MDDEMNPEEMDETEQKIIGMCICRSCPTYLPGADPIGYCSPVVGKNVKITVEDQCICPGCPVFTQESRTKTFFCTRDSEKEQTGGV